MHHSLRFSIHDEAKSPRRLHIDIGIHDVFHDNLCMHLSLGFSIHDNILILEMVVTMVKV